MCGCIRVIILFINCCIYDRIWENLPSTHLVKYHFKIFCRLKQAAGCGWLFGIGSNKHSNLLTFTLLTLLMAGARFQGMDQWQQYQVMAPQLVTSTRAILLTVTSQGQQNTLQISRPVNIGQ